MNIRMAAPGVELPAPLPQAKSSAPFGLPSFSETLQKACEQPVPSTQLAFPAKLAPSGELGASVELANSADSALSGQAAPSTQTPATKAPNSGPQVKIGISAKQILLPAPYRTPVTPAPSKGIPAPDSANRQSEAPTAKTPTTEKQQPDEEERDTKKPAPHAPAAEIVHDTANLSAAAQQAIVATPDSTEAPAVAATKPAAEQKQASELDPAVNLTAISSPMPAAPSGELALAMRITTTDKGTSNPAPAVSSESEKATSEVPSSAEHTTIAVPAVPPAPQQKQESGQHSAGGGETGDSGTQLTPNGPSAASSKETAAPAASDFETEFNKFHSEPVKSAHVQISGENNASVDIRLVERGGALSVSVRSNDSMLAKTLTDHTSELTSRLSLDHYKAEMWTPSSSKNSSNERQGASYSGGSSSQGGSGNQQGKRQNSQQNQDPEWVQEFENLPGTFQKRIDYTWPQ